ncbi:hypothetical protein ACIP4Y_22260 [Streptomyces sp. NPDC088810]|uniref:hypothetical protein n=1 Tax=Streptomyces sp. NPDC088810 TaxID=3365904 RepID=UPI0038015629
MPIVPGSTITRSAPRSGPVRAARHLTPNGRRRILDSFVHGSTANALPQAIGAQFLPAPGPQARWG